MPTVGLAIPSIPPRWPLLERALRSVCRQTRVPDRINVVVDYGRQGAAATRNAAWRGLGDVDYVAFLDDDDELLSSHLERLLDTIGDADLCYPWFDVVGGTNPLAINGKPPLGHPFDDEARTAMFEVGNFIPITVLVRRQLLEEVGGFPVPGTGSVWEHDECEDWGCWQAMLRAGATFVHLPEITWQWHHDSGNTSGRADRW